MPAFLLSPPEVSEQEKRKILSLFSYFFYYQFSTALGIFSSVYVQSPYRYTTSTIYYVLYSADNNGVEKIPLGALPKLCLAYIKISPQASIQTAYNTCLMSMSVYSYFIMKIILFLRQMHFYYILLFVYCIRYIRDNKE